MEKTIEQIKKAIEKEFIGAKVTDVEILEKVNEKHYWVNWRGINPNSIFSEIVVPNWEVTIKK